MRNNFYNNHPPLWLLVTTPIIVTLAIPVSYYLFIKDQEILKKLILKNYRIYNFLLNKWYFDELYNLTRWKVGEYKALTEVFNENEYKYLAFSKRKYNVAIQYKKI